MSDPTAPDDRNQSSRFHFHWRLGRDVSLVILTTFAAVGGVIGASTGIAALRQIDRIAETQTFMVEGTAEETARAADSNPDNAHVTLTSQDRQFFVDAVMGSSDSEGWLLRSNLPSLDSERSYQLWSRSSRGVLPLAYVGQAVKVTHFSLPEGTDSLFLTEEPDTGSAQPSGDPMVSAELP